MSQVPSQVVKRDGRIVPFEADRITQSLFAATEAVGQPNAFLAREMTDGVLHFLALDLGDSTPTTTQIAELVAKVVRELGQPELARAYEQGRADIEDGSAPCANELTAFHYSLRAPVDEVRRGFLRDYSLHVVFSRDLAAAHEEGLITLAGLTEPEGLAAMVVGGDKEDSGHFPDEIIRRLHEARSRVLIWDSPEYHLEEHTAGPWLRTLVAAARALAKRVVVHVHTTPPPAWARPSPAGPLFTGPVPTSRDGVLRALLQAWSDCAEEDALSLHWHLSESESETALVAMLQHLPARAGYQAALHFHWDRARQGVVLGEGIDRERPAVLMRVGLNLPLLLGRRGVDGDVERFLQKLPSLARMAIRAGVQKRRFLREHGDPSLLRGFLLDRATLVVVPRGLLEVLTGLLGRAADPTQRGPATELCRRIVQAIDATVQAESASTGLPVTVGAPDADGEPLLRLTCPLAATAVQTASGWAALFASVGCLLRGSPEACVPALAQLGKKTLLQSVIASCTGIEVQ